MDWQIGSSSDRHQVRAAVLISCSVVSPVFVFWSTVGSPAPLTILSPLLLSLMHSDNGVGADAGAAAAAATEADDEEEEGSGGAEQKSAPPPIVS